MKRCLLLVLAASGCVLPSYTSGVVPCEQSTPCPDGFVCVDRDGSGRSLCVVVGCGDGILDQTSEACDDGNNNNSDGCDNTCQVQELVADTSQAYGFGPVGGNSETPLNKPAALAGDRQGNIVVSTIGDNVLLRLTQDNDAFTVGKVGGNGTMVDVVRLERGERPDKMSTAFVTEVEIDGLGNIYLVNIQESVVRRVDGVTGLVDTIAGTGITVSSDAEDAPGPITSIAGPAQLVVDGLGAVFFAEQTPDGTARRIRRVDPDTGRMRTVFETALRINELTFDDSGRLFMLSDDDTGTLALRQLEERDGVLVEQNLRTVRVEQPTRGANQSRMVTKDGDTFFFVMGVSVVAVDFAAGTHRVVASARVRDEGEADLGLGLSRLLSDLALVGDELFVADAGNAVVWRLRTPTTTDNHQFTRDDVAAGEFVDDDTRGDLIDELAFLFARESDGHVTVGATSDCCIARFGRACSGGITDEPRFEFSIAFPELHTVAFSDCDNTVGLIAGTGEVGGSDVVGLALQAALSQPSAMVRLRLTPESDFFYIADTDNHRIRRVRKTNIVEQGLQDIETFLGPGDTINGVALNAPQAVGEEQQGLLIADTGNNRVLRVDLNLCERVGTAPIACTAQEFGTGWQEPAGLVHIALSDLALEGVDLPLDVPPRSGLLFVVEKSAHRIRAGLTIRNEDTVRYDELFSFFGELGDDDSSDTTTGKLRAPRSLMFGGMPDLERNIVSFYVVDAIDRLRKVDVDFSDVLFPSARVTTRGSAPSLPSRLDGTRGDAVFRSPTSVAALDAQRRLVVDRATGRVRLIDGDTVTTVLGTPRLVDGADIVVDKARSTARYAWIAEAGGLRRLNVDTWEQTRVTTEPSLTGPEGVFIDGDFLYVADAKAHIVMRFVLGDDGALARGKVIAGQANARGFLDGADARAVLLSGPSGVVARGDVVIIADTGNNRVRRVDIGRDGHTIRTILGDGTAANGGDGAPASSLAVRAPRSLALDTAGNVYVTAGSAVRLISVGDAVGAVADAGDKVRVSTVFGTVARRGSFPENGMRCLDDVLVDGDTVLLVDGCAGTIVPTTLKVR